MPIKSRMSLIMGQIKPDHPELFALEFGQIAKFDFVYTLAFTNINQWAPNFVKMYVTIRSWMSFNRTRTVWIICPWICKKNAESNFVYTLATANVDQLVPNMILMYVAVRSWKSSIITLIGTEW